MRAITIGLYALLFCFAVGLSGCGKTDKLPVDESKIIVFGTTVGDFGDMVKEAVQPALAKQGYQVKLIEFTDYLPVNQNLAEKNIDINIFQHRPYLANFIEQRHENLLAVFEVPTAGLGLYSGLSHDLNTKKTPLTVAVPNDPSNLDRALLLLQDMGFIRLRPAAPNELLTPKDITLWHRQLKLVELDAAQLPRARQDVDFAIINGNYAKAAGINVAGALVQERGKKYINVAVIRPEDQHSAWVKAVTDVYNSPQFKAYARRKFTGYNFPAAWGHQGKNR